MKRVLTYETEKLLGEILASLATGWAVHQPKIHELLLAIKRDLRIGVKEQKLPRYSKARETLEFEKEVSDDQRAEFERLSDGEIEQYERVIAQCAESRLEFVKLCGRSLEELLDKFRDLTE